MKAGVLVTTLCLLTLARPAAAQDVKSAESFLRALYAGFAPGKKPLEPLDKDVDRLFTPALAGLIKAEKALSVGEVGVFDADPICACQDWDKLKVTKVEVTADGPKRAQATVVFQNGSRMSTVRYWLAVVDGKWRIANMSEHGLEDMKKALLDGIVSEAKELAK